MSLTGSILVFRHDFVAAGQDQAALGSEVDLAASGGIAAHGVGFADGAVEDKARETPTIASCKIRSLSVVFQRIPAARGRSPVSDPSRS